MGSNARGDAYPPLAPRATAGTVKNSPSRTAGLASVLFALCACTPTETSPPPSTPATVAPVTPPASASDADPRVVTVPEGAEEPVVDSLTSTMEQALRMLQEQNHRGVIELLLDPDDRERFRQRGDLDAIVQDFAGSEKPKQLLDALEAARGVEPERSEDGNEVTFPEEGDLRRLRFRRVHGRWYLRN